MRSWDEVWAFVKGTRPRPPPGPSRPRVSALLIAAAFAHLPIVYLLVATRALPAPLATIVGMLAMGLAWSGGVALEGRRGGTTRAFAGLGLLQGVLAFVPQTEPLGPARWLFLLIAALSAAALLMLRAGKR